MDKTESLLTLFNREVCKNSLGPRKDYTSSLITNQLDSTENGSETSLFQDNNWTKGHTQNFTVHTDDNLRQGKNYYEPQDLYTVC